VYDELFRKMHFTYTSFLVSDTKRRNPGKII